jgi:hypothetical protein
MNDVNDLVYKYTILDVKVTKKQYDTNVKDRNTYGKTVKNVHSECV